MLSHFFYKFQEQVQSYAGFPWWKSSWSNHVRTLLWRNHRNKHENAWNLPAIQTRKPYDPLENDKGETTTTATNTTITHCNLIPTAAFVLVWGHFSICWFWDSKCPSVDPSPDLQLETDATDQDPSQSSFCKSSAVSAKPGRQAQYTS